MVAPTPTGHAAWSWSPPPDTRHGRAGRGRPRAPADGITGRSETGTPPGGVDLRGSRARWGLTLSCVSQLAVTFLRGHLFQDIGIGTGLPARRVIGQSHPSHDRALSRPWAPAHLPATTAQDAPIRAHTTQKPDPQHAGPAVADVLRHHTAPPVGLEPTCRIVGLA